MGFFKDFVEAFKEGYDEAENEKVQEIQNAESDEVTLSIISVGENRSMILQVLEETTDWSLEEIESFLDDMPNTIHGPEGNILYFQEKLQEYGADSYIVEEDELVILKVSSIGKNKAEAMEIIESTFQVEAGQELELPDYFKGPIEYLEKIYRKLKTAGADVELMGLEEYLEEVGENEDEAEMEAECTLHIMDAGVNKVALIRVIRECTDITELSEAKDFVDNLPQDLYGSTEVLENIKSRLDEIGVQSEINYGEREEQQKIVYCTECGRQIPSDAKFCMNCGTRRG